MLNRAIIIVLLIGIMVACTKPTVNNYINNGTPAFTVGGLTNVVMTNGQGSSGIYYMSLEVKYNDSAQQMVTLSLSTLPAGITIDSLWNNSGYPTFSTTLSFYDTSAAGASPGAYNMTLTAVSASGVTKTYPFKMIIKPEPSCTSMVTGKYVMCVNECNSTGYYTDSVYADPTVVNKVWFTNLGNTGQKVYANLECNLSELIIPAQTAGGYTFSGSGNINTSGFVNMYVYINGTGCTVADQN